MDDRRSGPSEAMMKRVDLAAAVREVNKQPPTVKLCRADVRTMAVCPLYWSACGR
jgi:hypothetical protein